MPYVNNFSGFGTTEPIGSEWWITLPAELKNNINNWIKTSQARQGLSATYGSTTDILRRHSRAAADGGGFVVGNECYCPPTATGAVSRVVAYPAQCPAGTGGVGGTPVTEKTAAQLAPENMALAPLATRDTRRFVGSATTGTAIGKVVDATSGYNIIGATVSLGPRTGGFSPAGLYTRTTTAADGTLTITKAPGSYDLVITATGYEPVTLPDVVLIAGETTNLGTVRISMNAEVVIDHSNDDVIEQQGLIGQEDLSIDGGDTSVQTDESVPWYKSPWAIGGGILVLGGLGYAAYRKWGK